MCECVRKCKRINYGDTSVQLSLPRLDYVKMKNGVRVLRWTCCNECEASEEGASRTKPFLACPGIGWSGCTYREREKQPTLATHNNRKVAVTSWEFSRSFPLTPLSSQETFLPTPILFSVFLVSKCVHCYLSLSSSFLPLLEPTWRNGFVLLTLSLPDASVMCEW